MALARERRGRDSRGNGTHEEEKEDDESGTSEDVNDELDTGSTAEFETKTEDPEFRTTSTLEFPQQPFKKYSQVTYLHTCFYKG